jgi:uncharacterized repeat protein (TIGR03837 family)
MLWDVFCRVIDNFGDIGVCWRLAVDLAGRGHAVRLWVDDAGALAWMAPQVRWRHDPMLGFETGQGQPGVTVCRWRDAERPIAVCPALIAGDVVVEAFGCDPPDAFVERMQQRAARAPRGGQTPQWINLEYLSAEDYVERSHGLRSPVWSGAGTGLSKRFFYPGFTPATGGLLREPGLIEAREAETATGEARAAVLRTLGIAAQPGDGVVLVFCYPDAPLDALLDRLSASQPAGANAATTWVLLAPGAASELGRRWEETQALVQAAQEMAGLAARFRSPLRLHHLPALPQPDFDRLLWCCDLNLVRGEDSAVRALWAGRPHIWQIYEQDDGVHAGKLDAFMTRWMAVWPPDLQARVRDWWLAWNRLGPMPDRLPDWSGAAHAGALARTPAWLENTLRSRAALLEQRDLVTQLLLFVSSSG